MRVLITGATGAIGQALCKELILQGHHVIATTRQRLCKAPVEFKKEELTWLLIPNVDAKTDWSSVITGLDCIIHLAARAHILEETAADPLPQFRAVNTDGTLNLARQAATAGVRRFVFVSSIGVNGNYTKEQAFTEGSIPQPHDAYAISKYEAEKGLQQICSRGAMEYVIVRPPLVYGPNVKGNFASLIRWITSGVPLPLGAVHNKRSLIALGNLVNFLSYCSDPAKTPTAANEIFVVSDDEAISTSELLRKVARAYGVKTRLLSVPAAFLWFGATLTGRRRIASRLLASLEIDSSKAHSMLGWRPIITMDEQLKEMANHVTDI